MRVLDINSFYSDRGGGVRTYHRAKLAYFASRRDHEYHLAVAGPAAGTCVVPGGVVHRMRGVPTNAADGYWQLCDPASLRRLIRRVDPDVIEIGSAYLDSWLTLAARPRGQRAKLVGFYHADFPDAYVAPSRLVPRPARKAVVAAARAYARVAYNALDATAVSSPTIAAKLRCWGVRNVVQTPLGVDTDWFAPRHRCEALRASLGVGRDDRLFLFSGRLHREKRLDVLVDAAEALAARGVHVVIVGRGPQQRALARRARGLPRLSVRAFTADPTEMARLHASADVYVSCGPYETFGLAAIEAMSSGTPVLAVDSGAAPDLVYESGAGAVFAAGCPDSLRRQAEWLVDQDLLRLGARARAFVEHRYTWRRAFDHQLAAYDALDACPRA